MTSVKMFFEIHSIFYVDLTLLYQIVDDYNLFPVPSVSSVLTQYHLTIKTIFCFCINYKYHSFRGTRTVESTKYTLLLF